MTYALAELSVAFTVVLTGTRERKRMAPAPGCDRITEGATG